MLEQILRSIKDYFIKEVWSGHFYIVDGNLADVDFLKEGQYFKIYGSDLNDGVYQYPATDLKDEDFNGEVWALKIPKEIIDIANEKEAWLAKYGDAVNSPFNSESFAGYAYTKKSSASGTSSNGGSGAASGTTFDERLNQWRKIRYNTDVIRNQYLRQTN
jgi:hypothetical protein